MNVPAASSLTARSVLATCRESTSRRSASLDEARARRGCVPSGRGSRLLLASAWSQLRLVDERALDQLAAEDGVGGDARGVARLGDAPLDEVDVDEPLGALDVQRAGPPHPAEHLQDLDDAERVKRALHGEPKSIIGPDERRPAHAHLPGLGLLAHRLPRPHRLVRGQQRRGGRPHQPRRRRATTAGSRAALAAEGVLLLHGVEITTLCGDFVVFSPDLDYLAGFSAVQDRAAAGHVAADAAVVWVHPGAGGGRSGSTYYSGHREHGRAASSTPSRSSTATGSASATSPSPSSIAGAPGRARAPAAATPTTPGDLMICYTEMPDPVRSTADVVDGHQERRHDPAPPRGAGPPPAPVSASSRRQPVRISTSARPAQSRVRRHHARRSPRPSRDAGEGAVLVYCPTPRPA